MLTMDLVDLTSLKLKGPRNDAYKGMVPKRMKYFAPFAVDGLLDLLVDAPWISFSDIYRDPIASLEARRSKSGVQRPGYSAHNYGFAFDVAVDQSMADGKVTYTDLLVILDKHGFSCHRSDGARGQEDWHFNFLGPVASDKSLKGSAGPQKLIEQLYGDQLQGDERWVQERLAAAGFYHGEIDGNFGPLSHAALAAFERAYDIAQDGLIDAISMRTMAIVTAKKNIIPLTSQQAARVPTV